MLMMGPKRVGYRLKKRVVCASGGCKVTLLERAKRKSSPVI